mgnify:CR=1 FL=1
MINQLLLTCSAIIIYEFIKYFKLLNIIQLNLLIYKKLFKIFKFKKVSDFRKELLIVHYAKKLFKISIKIIFLLSIIIIFFMIINFISNSFKNLIFSLLGIIEITIIFLIYHQIRKKIYGTL